MLNMFKPTYWLKNVMEIDGAFLKKEGIRGLILDMDNTLSMHDSVSEESGVADWVARMRELGVRMVVVSNNNARRVAPLADKLGLPYFSFGGKPLPVGVRRGRRFLRLPRCRVALVGDQIFTDILGGNLYGIRTVLVEPFHMENKLTFKLKRRVEELVWKRDYSKFR